MIRGWTLAKGNRGGGWCVVRSDEPKSRGGADGQRLSAACWSSRSRSLSSFRARAALGVARSRSRTALGTGTASRHRSGCTGRQPHHDAGRRARHRASSLYQS